MADETTNTNANGTTDGDAATTTTEASAVTSISELADGTELGGRSDWGNKLVVNTGTNPVINFAFMLRIEGVFDLPCKSVKGIQRENEFDYIQEGGLNDYVHLKRKPLSKPCTFRVERYVGVNWIDPMPLGTELVLPVILFVNKYCFPQLKPVRTYAFTGCTVIAKDYGELNAEASGLLIETVTIAYREMVCLDIPSETLEGDTWKFDGKKREGKGPRRYNSNLLNKEWETEYNSSTKMEAEALKHRYVYTGKMPAEGEYTAAKHNPVEKRKEAMEEGAKTHRYAFTGNLPAEGEYTAAKHNSEEKRIAAMEENANAHRYAFTGELPAEGEYTAAKHNSEEKRKAAMEKLAAENQWDPGNEESKHFGKDYEQYVTDHNAEIDKQIGAATDDKEKQELEATKKAMGGSASRKYSHSSEAKKYSSARHNEDEKTKKEMEKLAAENQWDPGDEASRHFGKDYKRYATDYNAEIDKQIEAATENEEKQELEATKKAMGGSTSRKYSHSSEAKKYSSARHNEDEKTKTAMEKLAAENQWDPGNSDSKRFGKDYKRYATDYNAEIDKQIGAATDDKEKQELEATKKAMGGSASRKYSHSSEAKKYSSARHNEQELSMGEMEKKAKKYTHSAKAPDGAGYTAAQHNSGEKRKADMEKNAKLWPDEKSAASKSMKTPEARLWPKASSAARKTMKTPEARLWPKQKSAKQITDFLKKH